MIEKAPIRFVPYLKSVIWGGDKICAYKGLEQNEPKIGESWEISAVPGHESVVSEGVYKGRTITDLIETFGRELLGDAVYEKYDGKFPLLIKLIDACDNLSVQVHPDDALAKQRHNSLGKTEMWYIIGAEKGAKIYAGLNRKITPEEYVSLVDEGRFDSVLSTHDSDAGDVFFLPAGRVHAIGAGNLLAEIQESSDVTYRIYDYDRRDSNGNARELHTQLAKNAIDYTVCDNYKSESPSAEVADAEIVSCEHFAVRRILVKNSAILRLIPSSFNVVMCMAGDARLITPDSVTYLRQGETVLCPSVMGEVEVRGEATLLLAGVKE